ncbi:MAG: FAD-binding protein [Beijerinckiaceae bacterium]
MSQFLPSSIAEACDVVRAAKAKNRTLRIEGGGTRRGLGRPVDASDSLGTRGLAGIVFHEPAEMTIRAKAGTPLAELEAALESNGQMLPFEPMDHRALLGTQGAPTIGAVAACNVSGPRRLRAGAARDALIGVRFVNGAGEDISSGGRVMKNVTGLDLVKLQCGAYGTLGLLTEVTFKLLPKPEASGTLVIEGLDERKAIEAMSTALRSPFEVSGAAHAPDGDVSLTAIRIEHFAPSVAYRLGELEKLLGSFGPARRLDGDTSQAFWRGVRDVEALAEPREAAIWRVSIRPSHAADYLAALRQSGLTFRFLLDHGGGLIWLGVAEDGDGAPAIRAVLPAGAGHAMLVRASGAARAQAPAFQPLAAPMMKLTSGVKASIDPGGIFNPGLMYDGV